jgi:hypothetical protein
MPPVGFEPTVSAGERLQAYALDRASTGTGMFRLWFNIFVVLYNFLLVPYSYPISGYPLTLLTLIDAWTVFTQFLATSRFMFVSFRLFLFCIIFFPTMLLLLCVSNYSVFIFLTL